MNQRSRNRSRHAAVLIGQLVERRNGRRIAQHYGDLTATGNAGGLALGAGFWLCHGSIRLGDFRDLDESGALFRKRIHDVESRVATACRRNVIRNGLQFAAFRRGVRADHAIVVHGSGSKVAECAGFIWRDGHAVRRCVASHLEESAAQIDVHKSLDLRKGFATSGHDFIKHSAPMTDWRKNAGRLHGGDFGGRVAVHGLLRSGSIPPMCESYPVTSDVSTGIST